jgi:hypothetical protein
MPRTVADHEIARMVIAMDEDERLLQRCRAQGVEHARQRCLVAA